MAAQTVSVSSIVIGDTRPGTRLGPVQLYLASETLTVRELITRTVEEQVEDLSTRQRLDAAEVAVALRRQYLSSQEVADQARHGSVQMPKTEVDRALRSFREGAFRVVVDGRVAKSLHDTVTLKPDSNVVFFRLVPLVGG